jgi:hypothetical protein
VQRIDVAALKEEEADYKERSRLIAMFHSQMRKLTKIDIKESPNTHATYYVAKIFFNRTDRAWKEGWFGWDQIVGGYIQKRIRRLFGMIASSYGFKYYAFQCEIMGDVLTVRLTMEKKDAKSRRYIPGLHKRM